MLKNVTIENFRLFKQFYVHNLAQVNLIVGKNNVGKTSLLEALHLLVSPDPATTAKQLLQSRGEYDEYHENDVRLRPPLQRYDFSHLFYGSQLSGDTSKNKISSQNGSHSDLRLSYYPDGVSDEARPRSRNNDPVLVFEKGEDEKYDLREIENQRFRSPNFSRVDNINYISTNQFNHYELASRWDAIISKSTSKTDGVIEMLKILDPSVENIVPRPFITSNSGILVVRKSQDKPMPLGSMGDGMSRILAIALALINSENGYLFVDEIDTGLHYRAITDMWNLVLKTAARLNIQVFATTHSLDCIRSFGEAMAIQEDPQVGRLLRLQRRGEQIESVNYTSAEIAFATEQEIEVR